VLFRSWNPNDTYAQYAFTLKDYAGVAWGGNTYIETYRVINDTQHLIERRLISNVATTIPFTFQQNEEYLMRLKIGSTVDYRFGWFSAGSTTDQTLVLHIVDFSTKAKLTYRYVIAEAWRSTDNTQITLNYEDTLEGTNSVVFYVKYKNGTVAHSDSSTADIVQFQWSSANATIDYKVELAINHADLGTVSYKQAVPKVAAVSSPFDFKMLGSSWPIASTQILSVFLIFVVAGIFSTLTAPLGIIVTVIFAGFLRMMGWYDIPLTLLSIIGSLAIAYAIAETKRRMGE